MAGTRADVAWLRAATPQHPPCFGKRACLVGEEHHPELADHDVEARIVERQPRRVCLLPLHRPVGAHRRGAVQHGLVQVGRNKLNVRGQCTRHRAGGNARTGGSLEHPRGMERRHTARQVGRVGLEDQWNEVALVDLGNGAGEGDVGTGVVYGRAPSVAQPLDLRRCGPPVRLGPRARTPPATLTAAAAAASSLRIPRLGDHEFEVLARHHQRGRARGVHLFEQHGDVTLQRLLPR